MDTLGVYLYCFSRPGAGCALAGVGGRSSIDTVAVAGVAAVVSAIPLAEYTGEGGQVNLRDPAWLLPRACRHEHVIEAVMRTSPVLPVRFGAVFSHRATLEELLEMRGSEIADFLESVAGKEEWEVRGGIDPEKVSGWMIEGNPELARRRQTLAVAPGARYFQEKKLWADAEQQARRWARSALAEVETALREFGCPMQPLGPRPRDSNLKGAEILQRWAVLVERDRLEAFRGLLEATRLEHGSCGLTLEQSGPWPPYHFCSTLGEADG